LPSHKEAPSPTNNPVARLTDEPGEHRVRNFALMVDRETESTIRITHGIIDGQMGQARWVSTGTARKSTVLARHEHDTIVLVPARGTI
jgi:hypothetical protein